MFRHLPFFAFLFITALAVSQPGHAQRSLDDFKDMGKSIMNQKEKSFEDDAAEAVKDRRQLNDMLRDNQKREQKKMRKEMRAKKRQVVQPGYDHEQAERQREFDDRYNAEMYQERKNLHKKIRKNRKTLAD